MRGNRFVIGATALLLLLSTLLLIGGMLVMYATAPRESTFDRSRLDFDQPYTDEGTTQVFVADALSYAADLMKPCLAYRLESPQLCDEIIRLYSAFVFEEAAPIGSQIRRHTESALQFSFRRLVNGASETLLFYLSENGVLRRITLDPQGKVLTDEYRLITPETLHWEDFLSAYYGRSAAVSPDKDPTSQSELLARFNTLNDTSVSSSGVRTVSILPFNRLVSWWKMRPATNGVVALETEEIFFLINDSIRLYNEYDRIILGDFSLEEQGNLSVPVSNYRSTVIIPIRDPHAGTDREDPRRTYDIYRIILYRMEALSHANCLLDAEDAFWMSSHNNGFLSTFAGEWKTWSARLWIKEVIPTRVRFYIPTAQQAANRSLHDAMYRGRTPTLNAAMTRTFSFFRILSEDQPPRIYYVKGTTALRIYPAFDPADAS